MVSGIDHWFPSSSLPCASLPIISQQVKIISPSLCLLVSVVQTQTYQLVLGTGSSSTTFQTYRSLLFVNMYFQKTPANLKFLFLLQNKFDLTVISCRFHLEKIRQKRSSYPKLKLSKLDLSCIKLIRKLLIEDCCYKF